ncbi:type IX secretion system sortase PorU [Bacteroidota bacterium]
MPFFMNKGTDELFGPGDYILFYAHGPISWEYDLIDDFYSHHLHDYAMRGYYFLTDDMGNSNAPVDAVISNLTPDQIVTSYDILDFFEEEEYNLLKSGREWYGDNFKLSLSDAYPFTLNNLIQGEPVKIRVTAAGRSKEQSSMQVKANNTTLGELSFNKVNLSSYTSTFAVEDRKIFSYTSSQEVITVQLEYLQPNSNSEAWLNHITLNARSKLELDDDELSFRDSKSVAFGKVSEFQLKNTSSNTFIWDVTEADQPRNVPYILNGNTATFKVSSDKLREYVAFNTAGTFPEPETSGDGLGKIQNQNLHGSPPPDMLIIYPEEFKEQAERLADHRRDHDNLTVLSVTQDMIFNEFSSGTPNISAIRNFLKMYYDNDIQSMTKYLLLFGDGSYDNRDTASNNPNKILTYQSYSSLVPTSSYVSDDFLGLLDAGEGLYDGLLDIGIGRLPVSTPEEADMIVDKIIEYDQFETIGEWRNYICLIGDDEDGNIHMKQANSLANYIELKHPNYNINKIFMDAYPQETTPTGDLYPDVTKAINDQMNRGALIINYTGHGGVTGLAHEKILNLTNIKAWNNKGKYPLFMTATCEFSRYDEYDASENIEVTSAGEEVLLNSEGGSIALFTTTRLVYSGPNHVLNEKFYEIIFEKKENGECYRLGDVIVYSKNNAGSGLNKRNFTLLGDPSMSLSFPKNLVITDSINHVLIEDVADTISALDYVTISGHIEDQNGIKLTNTNGTVIPIVYDKKSNLKTLSNDGGSPIEFQTRSNILYKGNVSVTNGKFSFGFYVPKDIGYNVGSGKISYYSFSENTDAHGSSEKITIGGLGDFTASDTAGPSIRIYMNDSLFKNGGIVNNDPELVVYVDDLYGINTTGNGIGHDITATLNQDRTNAVVLNEYYVSDRDSYSSGTVRYPYSDLPIGDHSINVKVWDIFNNSSSRTLNFKVVESMNMLLEEIYNYPNPFIDFTNFNIEHNRAGHDLEVVIRIYDMNGTLMTVLQNQQYASGFRMDPITWEGKNMSGSNLGGGMYIYNVFVRNDDGEEAVKSGRLIIKR